MSEQIKCPKGMVLIPGGTFKLGSTSGAPHERPVRKITISPLCADKHEVTNAEYRAVTAQSGKAKFELLAIMCGSGATSVVARGDDPKALVRKYAKKFDGQKLYKLEVRSAAGQGAPKGFDRPKQPVTQKNWHEARAYCEAQGKRLPTEVEWEYMARGSQSLEYGTRSGELKKSEAHYDSGATADVCSYPENVFGLCDMTGNVWEWTADWYHRDAYESMASKDPKGQTNSGSKVVRGGAWYNVISKIFLRAAVRNDYSPGYRGISVGFRCVAAPQTDKK